MKINRTRLNENGSISRRKKEFINKFGHIIAGVNGDSDTIDSSCLQQHHIDANTDNNPNDFSNFAYLYSEDAAHARLAHNYIHAKALVDNYNLTDVLYISSDGKITKASKNILDSIAAKLPNNFETKDILFTDDSAISESLNEDFDDYEDRLFYKKSDRLENSVEKRFPGWKIFVEGSWQCGIGSDFIYIYPPDDIKLEDDPLSIYLNGSFLDISNREILKLIAQKITPVIQANESLKEDDAVDDDNFLTEGFLHIVKE